jgi:hypothetical protein
MYIHEDVRFEVSMFIDLETGKLLQVNHIGVHYETGEFDESDPEVLSSLLPVEVYTLGPSYRYVATGFHGYWDDDEEEE